MANNFIHFTFSDSILFFSGSQCLGGMDVETRRILVILYGIASAARDVTHRVCTHVLVPGFVALASSLSYSGRTKNRTIVRNVVFMMSIALTAYVGWNSDEERR